MAEVAGDGAPVSARTASISLALPVSIISAPAPTVTMTATGTPIACSSTTPRRPHPGPPRRGAYQGQRPPAASLTDPCQARNSSSDSPSGSTWPPQPEPAAASAPAALKDAVGLSDSGACASSATGAPSGTRPRPAGQA